VQLDKKAPVEDRTGSSAATTSSNDSAKTGAANDGSADSRAGDKNAQNTDPLNDATGMLAKRSVYFDFDSYVVKDEFKPVIEAHSQYLIKNANRKIVIQGNTDERGGSEYNLALGQKRAEAVRRALNLLGVADSQIEAVSFGKEKPKATGSNEAAWAENRRADIAY
jgi:peptidoglycan-associated lipoprotein